MIREQETWKNRMIPKFTFFPGFLPAFLLQVSVDAGLAILRSVTLHGPACAVLNLEKAVVIS
jgi:hypothetical protein